MRACGVPRCRSHEGPGRAGEPVDPLCGLARAHLRSVRIVITFGTSRDSPAAFSPRNGIGSTCLPQNLRLALRAAHFVRQAPPVACASPYGAPCLASPPCAAASARGLRGCAAKKHVSGVQHSANRRDASAAASARRFCRSLESARSLVFAVGSRLFALACGCVNADQPRQRARTAYGPPNSAAAPDRAPSLGPVLKHLVLSGWRVSVGRARYGARPGEPPTVRPAKSLRRHVPPHNPPAISQIAPPVEQSGSNMPMTA